jgi:hypothetical protein
MFPPHSTSENKMLLHLHLATFVTTARRVLGLQLEGHPPALKGNCKYTEQAALGKSQGMVLQLGGWAWG